MNFYAYIGRVKKLGPLRFLSNMEYIRTLERTLRRAKFPLWMTRGFHPRPKLSFPVALATGTVDSVGLFEFRLTEDLSECQMSNLMSDFNSRAPLGLKMTNIWRTEKGGLLSHLIKYYEFRIIVEKQKILNRVTKLGYDISSLRIRALRDFVVIEYIMLKDKITKPENILNELLLGKEDEVFYVPICYRAFDKNFRDVIDILNENTLFTSSRREIRG